MSSSIPAGASALDETPSWRSRIEAWLASYPVSEYREAVLAEALADFVENGLDVSAPLPGRGNTLDRWQGLALLAGNDLSLAKLLEAHLDALCVLRDLEHDCVPARLAIWAAEPPDSRLRFTTTTDGRCVINGRKAWCSGAWAVDQALVTGWDGDDQQRLALVSLDQPGVTRTRDGWAAIGMSETQSVDVLFNGATGSVLGAPRAYLERPGFWHGGAGIAACWYGAAAALADVLRSRIAARADAHALAHLGAVDTALHGARVALHHAASVIDSQPLGPHAALVLRTRLLVENAASLTLDHCGRAMGATPFCRDAAFAKRAADLPVFLRQSHAERDLESLGKMVIGDTTSAWAL